MNWTHGATSAWLALGLTAAGLLIGTFLGRANLKQTVTSLVLAIPLTIVTALVWNAILWLLPFDLGENFSAFLGLAFFVACAAVVGKLLAGRRLPASEHERGTVLGAMPERSQTHG